MSITPSQAKLRSTIIPPCRDPISTRISAVLTATYFVLKLSGERLHHRRRHPHSDFKLFGLG